MKGRHLQFYRIKCRERVVFVHHNRALLRQKFVFTHSKAKRTFDVADVTLQSSFCHELSDIFLHLLPFYPVFKGKGKANGTLI